MKKIIGILCVIFLLASCYRELDFSDEVNNTVVVSSFVANDSLIKVNILKAIPVDEISQKVYVTDASVKLYEDNVFVENLALADSTYELNSTIFTTYHYQTKNTKAKVGKTYQVEITTADGKLITSETSIPQPVEIISIDTTFTYAVNQEDHIREANEVFKVRFKDPSGNNYYRITMTTRYGTTNGNKFVNVWTRSFNSFYPLDTIFSYFSEDDNNNFSSTTTNNFLIFNDESINGQEFELTLKRAYTNVTYYGSRKGEFTQYIIELQSLTKEGYDYLRSIDLQTQSSGIIEPEPVMAYSNIENGVGIFAGYSASQKTITVGEYPIDGFTYIYK